jgi:hypothetical protein
MGLSACGATNHGGRTVLDPFFESLHRASKVGPEAAKLFGAKDEEDDDQNDQPVPNAE